MVTPKTLRRQDKAVIGARVNALSKSVPSNADIAARFREINKRLDDHGITVDLTHEEERITYGGNEMEITARQAKMAAAIVRAFPDPVGRIFLGKKIWNNKPPSTYDAMIDMIATDLGAAIKPLGLHVKNIRAVGIALTKST